jgi:glycosyltransferase involved in cell wall biosynthesis
LGRPVIASGVGGILTVLDDNNAGITVPASDSRQLAEAIGRLIHQPEQAREMAQSGRALVERRFSLKRMVDEVTALYSELCSDPPASVRLPQTTPSSHQDAP